MNLGEISDDYEHPDNSLEYILENVLFESRKLICDELSLLQHQYNSVLLNSCHCQKDGDCSGCVHGSNYILHSDSNSTELVLNVGKSSDLLYECSKFCNCKIDKCNNRLVQFGPRKHLEIRNSNVFMSKGLITLKDIPRGGFICEYAGELLTYSEARRRISENNRTKKDNYILCLNEFPLDAIDPPKNGRRTIIVDPSRKGNIGRYLNHSCFPNCELYSVRVDCPLPKIAIFAKRNIKAGEELCFHYSDGINSKEQTNGDRKLCQCGTQYCQKYLPNIEF